MFSYKETMDTLIKTQVDSGYVSGASALVLKDDKEAYFYAYGYADKENGTPMKRDTIIRLFSMTKPITAAAVMILVERGELEVRDAVSKYLPEYADVKVWTEGGLVPPERPITIWDLLNMTSGIPYPGEVDEPGRRMGAVLKELIDRRLSGEMVNTREYARKMAKVPLCFQPGDRWMYGFSADILGAVVEVVSGMRYSEFLQKELFEPLEMTDTGFFVPAEKRERFAQFYEWCEEEKVLKPFTRSHLGEYYHEDVAFESGGAGLTSTLDDYSHFATMMLHEGVYKGRRILGKKTVEFMTQNHLTEHQRRTCNWDSIKGYGYGCLMRVLMDKSVANTNAPLGEYGWDGWAGDYMTIVPQDNMIIMYFIQRCAAGTDHSTVRKIRMATFAACDDF